ncbi:hypothetical protein ZEAMMB73_Zm00001d012888 [Zea mays]|uniref:Uncharacterized protein n=1 Tax=Zea mays TaxID=4577 RepID=A0A1D6GDP4_MAIZE|nr:hypothetical protein ZEAMMB73_Zm00001d012888 [Zea mays]
METLVVALRWAGRVTGIMCFTLSVSPPFAFSPSVYRVLVCWSRLLC